MAAVKNDEFKDLKRLLNLFRRKKGLAKALRKFLTKMGDKARPLLMQPDPKSSCTPLFHAISRGAPTEVLGVLIEFGADLEAEAQGYRPVHVALSQGQHETVKYLHAKGAVLTLADLRMIEEKIKKPISEGVRRLVARHSLKAGVSSTPVADDVRRIPKDVSSTVKEKPISDDDARRATKADVASTEKVKKVRQSSTDDAPRTKAKTDPAPTEKNIKKKPEKVARHSPKADVSSTAVEAHRVAKLSPEKEHGIEGLVAAIQAGNTQLVKRILAHESVDLNSCNRTGLTPLLAASSCGEYQISLLLIDRGANNFRDMRKRLLPRSGPREGFTDPVCRRGGHPRLPTLGECISALETNAPPGSSPTRLMPLNAALDIVLTRSEEERGSGTKTERLGLEEALVALFAS